MKTKHSIGITDLRHQLDHITSKRIQLFQEYGKAGLFLLLTKLKEIELLSDGNEAKEIKVI